MEIPQNLDIELIKALKAVERLNPEWTITKRPGSPTKITFVKETPDGQIQGSLEKFSSPKGDGSSIALFVQQQEVTLFQKGYGHAYRTYKKGFLRDTVHERYDTPEFLFLTAYFSHIIDPDREKRIAEEASKDAKEKERREQLAPELRKKFFGE